MALSIHTKGGLRSKSFSFRYAASCDLEFTNATGTFRTPGFDLPTTTVYPRDLPTTTVYPHDLPTTTTVYPHDLPTTTVYPRNQACSWRIRPQTARPFTITVAKLTLQPSDLMQIFEIDPSNTKPLFTSASSSNNQNFTGSSFDLHVQSGDALLKLLSGPIGQTTAFVVSYSVDCPALTKGDLVVLSTPSRVLGAEVRVSCPTGYELSSQAVSVTTRCLPGGEWSLPRVPQCQPLYCGPAPRFPNAVPVNVSAFTYLGTIDYRCLDGFAFESDLMVVASITCTANATWTVLPNCLPKRCAELLLQPVTVSHLLGKVQIGTNYEYGSVVSFFCQPGYVLTGANAVVCRANGTWSDAIPACSRQRCSTLPQITNGFIHDRQQSEFLYGDTLSVGCLPGFRLRGPDRLQCNINETFGPDLPECVDIDECQDRLSCDADSTTCVNVPGDHYCQCRSGYDGVPACSQSVMFGIGAFRPEIYPVTVSGSVPEYDQGQIGLSSKGWCGSAAKPSDNWVEVDLKAPKVISAVRILPVIGGRSTLATVKSFTLTYRSLNPALNKLPGNMTHYAEPNGDPIIFTVYLNSTSGIQLPVPIETQLIRVRLNDYSVGPCMRLDFIGCWKQSCFDIDECLTANGYCDQICANTPGSRDCGCRDGYQLYQSNGTSHFYLSGNETGLLEGDVLLFNRTCVPQSCLPVLQPINGVLLNTQPNYRFGDVANFVCQFGFEMVGSESLRCIENGEWSDSQPLCVPAQCRNYQDDMRIGFQVDPRTPFVGLGRNVSLVCSGAEYRLPGTVMAGTRKCVFDRRDKDKSYWLTGRQPTCEVVDCGRPQVLPGSFYSNLSKTTYSASFRFACVSPFAISGESSLNDDVVRCTKHGIWDFGSLRCDGPTCSDPGRPPDGVQIATTYEESATVRFQCTRPGYALTDSNPLMCLRQTDCGMIQPVGLSAGWIPETALKGTSELNGFELRNIRLSSSTGWCAQRENFTYAEMNLGRVYRLETLRLKGVVSPNKIGRVTQLRLFTKLEADARYVAVEPDFTDNPGSYGALSTIVLQQPVRARFVAVGVLSYFGQPCMKMELYGCAAPTDDKAVVGWNATTPMCVDVEPPRFVACPVNPVLVHKSATGKLDPVNYDVPVAVDNSGRIARIEVRPNDFLPGSVVFDDMAIEYTAFDADGNNASCTVQVRIVDEVPPMISCPKSYNITLDPSSDSAYLHFNTSTHPLEVIGGLRNRKVIFSPDHAKVLPNSYVNVTAMVTDANNSSVSCTFEVAALPFPCSEGGLSAPENGYNDCRGGGTKDGRVVCTVACNKGFVFVNETLPDYVCDPKAGWSDTFVPDCVPDAGHDTVYDAAIGVLYMVTMPPSADCVMQYGAYLSSQQGAVADMLSIKCSKTIDVPITVSPLNATVLQSNASNLALEATFRFRVTPSRFSKSLFDLCGLTIDTLFDFSSPPTDPQMSNLAKLRDATGTCPNIEAIESNSTRGFTCLPGQVLIKNAARMVCLECPHGTYAPDSSACVKCPQGTYQDGQGQTTCLNCPVGFFTPLPGSKSVDSCLPTCGLGTYSPNGVLPCLSCPKDTYSSSVGVGGAKSCTPCPPGTFTVTAAARSVEKCRPQCVPGEYSLTGLAPCTSCPLNYISLMPAAKGCEECRMTTFTPGRNSTTCDEVTCPTEFCLNGGRCEVANHRAICRCLPGFVGALCQDMEDLCVSQPCFNGGFCSNVRGSFKCSCPAGYSGLQCEIDPKDCASISCPNRGMCQNTIGTEPYKCLCRKGFAGAFCNETVDPCAAGVCMNGGSCQRLQMDRFHCRCAPGFNGTFCENNIDDCSDSPCANGGTCTDLVHDFRCDCAAPFSGTYCEDKQDLCGPTKCHNGFCYEDLSSDVTTPPVGRCVCDPGWMGVDCSVTVDNCAGVHPCQNNGTCRSTAEAFECDCPAAYTGSLCQHKVDHCAGSPCANGGTCVADVNNFRCNCPPGTNGTHCEINLDDCDPFPCHINHTDHCTDLINNFTCGCLPGFGGRTCDRVQNGCLMNQCFNGGTCRETVEGFNCSCPAGWFGTQCEKRKTACTPNPCENDGMCFDVGGGNRTTFYCKCPPSFYGRRCSRSTDPCFGNPCLNSGTCTNVSSTATGLCQCSKDFFGPGCAYEVDSCSSGMCHNGATCEDYTIGFKCSCARGFLGETCETNENSCQPQTCPSDSKCVNTRRGSACQCRLNFTGEDCRKTVDTDFDFRFYDHEKSSGAVSIVPFSLNTTGFTVGVWVKYAVPGDTGIFLQVVGSDKLDSGFDASKRLLIQLTESGASLSLFSSLPRVFIPFQSSFQISDGNWHHVVVAWASSDGSWLVTVDSIRVDGGLNYGATLTIPPYGSIVAGVGLDHKLNASSQVIMGSGMEGQVSQCRVWSRALDFLKEIPQLQNCGNSIEEDLMYRLVDVVVLNEKTEFARPSRCARPELRVKRPLTGPLSCSASKDAMSAKGFANVTWNRPAYSNIGTTADTLITNMQSGRFLPPGRHPVSFLRFDNSTIDTTLQQCHLAVYVHRHPCPDLSPPTSGTVDCSDYGPDNHYRRCTASCLPSYDFSEPTSRIFTCEADSKWHPSFNSTLLRLPACTPTSNPQRMFTVSVAYPNVQCNDQTRQFLQMGLQRKLLELQLDWPTCLATNCPGLNVFSECSDFSSGRRSKRQASELTGVMLNLTFPAVSDPIRNSASRETNTVRAVMDNFAFLNGGMDFQSQLPNAVPLPRNVEIAETLLCTTGTVLRGTKCVTCAAGTFQSGASCQRCPQGYYQDELGRIVCKICPAFGKRRATTLTTGSTAQSDCKETCSSGHYFNLTVNQCLPCGFGSYQQLPGQFECNHCAPHYTTTNETSTTAASCLLDCGDGEDLDADTQKCRPCPIGTYRPHGNGPSCFQCPRNFSTRANGSSALSDCSVPLCGPGSFFDQGSSVCIICPFGFYQPQPQQPSCLQCPDDTTTVRYGADSLEKCVSTNKCISGEVTCHADARCFKNGDGFKCICKLGFKGDGMEVCEDMCSGYCFNQGRCTKDARGNPYCECVSSFYGERCQSKSDTAYIAGGIAGAVLFIILLILLIWMICVRTRSQAAPPVPPKVSPYGIGGGAGGAASSASSNGMLYSIEYPPSCSTATVRSHAAAYVPYYENDDSWEMSGYSNTAFVNDGSGTMDKRSGRSVAPGKIPAKADPAAVYDIVHKYRSQMKEVVPIEPPVEHPEGLGGGLRPSGAEEPSARL